MTTVYASIGNSDDKLTQKEWSMFSREFTMSIREGASLVYGEWFSLPDAPFQNACMAFEIEPGKIFNLQKRLAGLRAGYRQESIAWAEVPATAFL